MIPMIATKTATLMVAMAVMGIVPVAAHAQSVDSEDIAAIESAVESATAASTDQTQANVDETEQTGTNVAFATVGAGGTFNNAQSNNFNDNDNLSNENSATTSASSTNTIDSTVEATQQPTLTVGETLALLP